MSEIKRNAKKRVVNAISESAMIITFLRFQRSTRAPAKGDKIISGSMPISEMVVSMMADPVDSVRYHTSAKPTRRLPIRENACPIHIGKNVRRHCGFSDSLNCVAIENIPFQTISIPILFIIHEK